VYDNPIHLINLCQEFFVIALDSHTKYPAEPVNNFAHEMSIFLNTAQAIDIAYGETDSLKLAKSNPKQAVNNADNYGYFVAFANSTTC
jgi:hypothetical protein